MLDMQKGGEGGGIIKVSVSIVFNMGQKKES